MAVQLWPLTNNRIITGGLAVIAAYGTSLGGKIVNPIDAFAQGISSPESIYVDLTGPAALMATATTFEIGLGQSFDFPSGTENVWINAASAGHKFGGYVVFPPTNFTPNPNAWPPFGPTTLGTLIPSYVYQEYSDDDDIQAFFSAYNNYAQLYIDWFQNIELPVITNPNVNGALLDWVALGLYGMQRPLLPSTFINVNIGALNTWVLNGLVLDGYKHVGPSTYYIADDDTFRRILIWHLYKGDGKRFDIRWLKRRIQRFLTGANGGAGTTDQTYGVSVTFGVGNNVDINFNSRRFISAGGSILNTNLMNGFVLNDLEDVVTVSLPVSPFVNVFKAAVLSGALELPFQYTFTVNISS